MITGNIDFHFDLFLSFFRCTTLSRNGADRETFVNENGRTVNIADYYVQKYKKRLRFPSAPMIQVGTGKNVKYFPLELMRVAPRQPHRGQVDEIMQVNQQPFAETRVIICNLVQHDSGHRRPRPEKTEDH